MQTKKQKKTDLSDKEALKLLSKKIDANGYARTTIELGYSSESALRAWIRRGKLPVPVRMLIFTLWGGFGENHRKNTVQKL